MVLTDMSVVLILNCCLYTCKMSCLVLNKPDPDYVPLLHDPWPYLHEFMELPQALNRPVISPQERMDEIGLRQVAPDAPIQSHFASWMECSDQEYCQQIAEWIQVHETDILVISSWLAVHGLDVSEYIALLQWGDEADGLEVWAASLALGRFMNVVMDDTVWATAHEGFNHGFPSLLMTNFGHAILCEVELEEDLPSLGAAVPAPTVSGQQRMCKGHPLSQVPEYP